LFSLILFGFSIQTYDRSNIREILRKFRFFSLLCLSIRPCPWEKFNRYLSSAFMYPRSPSIGPRLTLLPFPPILFVLGEAQNELYWAALPMKSTPWIKILKFTIYWRLNKILEKLPQNKVKIFKYSIETIFYYSKSKKKEEKKKTFLFSKYSLYSTKNKRVKFTYTLVQKFKKERIYMNSQEKQQIYGGWKTK